MTVIEQQPRFGGNHVWSFFDTDIPDAHRWVLDGLLGYRWADHDVRFPQRRRRLSIGYNSILSPALHTAMTDSFAPHALRLGEAVRSLSPRHVELESGERIEADAVIDARGDRALPGLAVGYQKFVGRTFEFPDGHGVARPVIMDAEVAQHDGYRFVYYLPFTPTRLLIEDTYYSSGPNLDRATLNARIEQAAKTLGRGRFVDEGEESGVLPIVMDGDFDRFWPAVDKVPRLGTGGCFFHPTTSYSLPDAVANAALLADRPDWTADGLAAWTRARSRRLWRERAYYRMLGRMLFRASDPAHRYKVLEHFYRLPEASIARFYGARMTALDKVRVLTGKPPVPVGRALRAILGGAQ